MKDKYSAVWVSHSSISDFLTCPRAYYLRNIYKDPKTGHKINIVTPPLSLGSAVHEVIESLAVLPAGDRLKISLTKKLDPVWLKFSGKKGGFKTYSEESEFRDRAISMLKNLEENPGLLLKPAIKIKAGKMNLPNYYLSESENIILCGKIDWLSYNDDDDSVHIIDFKTGKNEEDSESLQLPIYLLLASNTQSKKVTGAKYWYLDNGSGIVEKKLPKAENAFKNVLKVAKEIKDAREHDLFNCPKGGCFKCRPFEKILRGEAELVGVADGRQDLYILKD